MASVDGSRSVQAASDELFDYVCDPCGNEGNTIEAKQYCGVCSEFLCDPCVKSHRKFQITKNHKIVPATTVSVSSSRRISLYCGCKNNREPEYYCENHDDVTCSPCKDIKHHQCKLISIQQKSSGYKSSQIDAILVKSKYLKEKYDQLKQKCSTNKKELGRSKDICQNEMKAFRKELNGFLDRLEQKMLKELSDIEVEKRRQIDEQITTLTNALQMLDAEYKILAKAKADGRNQIMLTAEVQTSKTIRDCESRLADLTKDITELILSFEKNKKLEGLLTVVKSFGAINKIEKKDGQGEKIVLLGKHVQSRREVNVRLGEDRYKPRITGCAVMPGGNIVICDNNNDRLKLFDNSWVYQGSLTIPGVIYDVSVVDANTVIVTAPHTKKLQYVQILPQLQRGRAIQLPLGRGIQLPLGRAIQLPQLQLGRTIQLDSYCWRVCVSGDDIYVRCTTSDGRWEIRVLGLDGTEKRRVPVDRNSSPNYITLSPSGEKIFFTDWDTNIVTCMTVDGRTVYTYKDDNLKITRGMYCDSEDNLFVCGWKSNTVQAITADGKSGDTLLTSSDGLVRPNSIAYRSSDDELIVGCYLEHILVYKMEK